MSDGTWDEYPFADDPWGDLAYLAWVVIANVSEGDWSKQTPEWQEAAANWRDKYHGML